MHMLQAYRMVLTLEQSEGDKDKNAVLVMCGVQKHLYTLHDFWYYGTLSLAT
jgi:hypothetical protein